MIIKDVNGKYELKVDKQRRIVQETAKGAFEAEDFKRMNKEYHDKIVPYLGKGNWAKINDMKEYRPSTKVTPEMINDEAKKLFEKGFTTIAVLLDSATLKMQLGRAGKELVDIGYFDKEKDAYAWLKTQGF